MELLSSNARSYIHSYIALDVRALAFMRITLAIFILYDLGVRVRHLAEHYGNYGVFPVELWRSIYAGKGGWSLHMLSGNPEWTLFLMVVTAICACALCIGWQTRLATLALWLLTVSLNHANPFIVGGQDALLQITLFLSLFLPLDARFSVDAIRRGVPLQSSFSSTWTAAYLIQIGLLYIGTSLQKSGVSWQDGSAVYYALSLENFRTPLGDILYQFPFLMHLSTVGVHLLQWSAIFLLFFPLYTWVFRGVLVVLLMIMHASFGLTMHVGFFSWITLIALVPLIPYQFLDALGIFIQKHFTRATTFVTKHSARSDTRAYAQKNLPNIRLQTVALGVGALLYVGTITALNLSPLGGSALLKINRVVEYPAVALGINQHWNMFAPNPGRVFGWFVAKGTYSDGSEMDLLPSPHSLSYERPSRITFTDERETKYMLSVAVYGTATPYANYYTRYLCMKENERLVATLRLTKIDLTFIGFSTLPNYETFPFQKLLISYTCPLQ